MSVTAARLGSSPLMLDWSGILRNPKSISGTPASKSAFEEIWKKLQARFAAKEVGFYDAPITPEINQLAECQTLSQKILNSGSFTDALFLGIGGSSLGPISLLSALSSKNQIKV